MWCTKSRAGVKCRSGVLQGRETLEEAKVISLGKEAVIKRHLWYPSETLVGLTFFDEEFNQEETRRLQDNLSKPALKKVSKRTEEKTILGSFSDILTSRAMDLFTFPDVDDSFAENLSTSWERKSKYLEGQEWVHDLSVISDSAERGISLT